MFTRHLIFLKKLSYFYDFLFKLKLLFFILGIVVSCIFFFFESSLYARDYIVFLDGQKWPKSKKSPSSEYLTTLRDLETQEVGFLEIKSDTIEEGFVKIKKFFTHLLQTNMPFLDDNSSLLIPNKSLSNTNYFPSNSSDSSFRSNNRIRGIIFHGHGNQQTFAYSESESYRGIEFSEHLQKNLQDLALTNDFYIYFLSCLGGRKPFFNKSFQQEFASHFSQQLNKENSYINEIHTYAHINTVISEKAFDSVFPTAQVFYFTGYTRLQEFMMYFLIRNPQLISVFYFYSKFIPPLFLAWLAASPPSSHISHIETLLKNYDSNSHEVAEFLRHPLTALAIGLPFIMPKYLASHSQRVREISFKKTTSPQESMLANKDLPTEQATSQSLTQFTTKKGWARNFACEMFLNNGSE